MQTCFQVLTKARHADVLKPSKLYVEGHFENPSKRKKAQLQGQQVVGKQVAKPLGLSSRNNGSQTYKVNKWALRRQMGLRKLGKREITYPWAVYDIEK